MVIEADLNEVKTGYDWEEVFGEGSGGNCTGEVESLDGTATDPVLRENVVEVIASVVGENDGDSWICIVRLNDGRFACCEGSCDYTGWDCQAGNTITVASSLDSLMASGVTPEWAKRLGMNHFQLDDTNKHTPINWGNLTQYPPLSEPQWIRITRDNIGQYLFHDCRTQKNDITYAGRIVGWCIEDDCCLVESDYKTEEPILQWDHVEVQS